MPTTLIVLAHPEPRSFNGAWSGATATACAAQGHVVLRSDLTTMGFDAVEARQLYPAQPADVPFDPLKAQEDAAASGHLPDEVATEIDKLTLADLVVFHFPLWWFAPPAVLKGWFDRVLVHGALHDIDRRFDRGHCRGKRALFCVTTGATAAECGPDGKEGNVGMLLWPAAYTLRYLGFDVYAPECLHGVHGYFTGDERIALEQRLRDTLDKWPEIIAGLNSRPLMPFNADNDFDADGRLRPDAPSHSPFIRHRD